VAGISNELLWIIFMILDLSVAVTLFRFLGKNALFALIVANIILCNIQVTKIVTLFGLTATLGNILYGSIFFATDVLSEVYGKKEANKGVLLGFIALILMTVYMQIAIRFSPAPSDFVSEHLDAIFSFMPRIALGSIVAYLVSQYHDVWSFHFWKNKTKGKHLWIRNNFSTIASQAIDSLIFCIIAFLGVFDTKTWFELLFTTYIFKVIVAVFDTPFIYLGKYFGKRFVKEEANESE